MGRARILFCLTLLVTTEVTFSQTQTIFWLDTLTTDSRFIKIYSTPENNWKNLFAEWGRPGVSNKIDLGKFEKGYLIGQTSFELSWTTANSFVLRRGCGTNCSYVLVFNDLKDTPYWIPADITPNTTDTKFYLQDARQIVHFDDDGYLQLVIEDVDSRKKFKVKLNDDWSRGVGTFLNIVDSLTINNAILSVYQKDDNGKIVRQLTKKIELK